MQIVTSRRLILVFVCAVLLAGTASTSSAQIVESVGTRALGMGGAFVAVASDSSATWWNPAGLASGPFGDVALGRGVVDLKERLPARRDSVSWFAATVPALGVSYYRLRITDIQRSETTEQSGVSREDTQIGPSSRSFSASSWGVTLVQSIFPGVHVGTTLKYIRGTVRHGGGDQGRAPGDMLDDGEDLDGGATENRFDLDAGVLAVTGPFRVGAVIRNLRAPRFGDGGFSLPRQARVGLALNLEDGGGPRLTLAVDADARTYATTSGDRRVVATGAERWLGERRIGLRAGARFNLAGAKDRVATAGASVLVRSGFYVEGQVAHGGSEAEHGWGLGARVTF